MLHTPIMVNETINALNIKAEGVYVDLTIGYAGHAQMILKNLKNIGRFIGFDKDKEAIKASNCILKQKFNNFQVVHSDFKDFKNKLKAMKILKVDGIIADLGVSSPQIDQAKRGFSYNKKAKLDMRMDQSQILNASTIVNNWSKNELIEIFKKYGNVKFSQRIAQNIILNRPINSTIQLVEVIRQSLPAAIVRKKNPAKNIFQAIRITVNNEIESLHKMLNDAKTILKTDGRLCIITFHSIEDRIVKKFFTKLTQNTTDKLPIMVKKEFSSKRVKPSKEEIAQNKRARSAKLRILIKE